MSNTEAKRLQDLANKKEGARRRGVAETDGVYSLSGIDPDWLRRAMSVPPIVLPEGTVDSVDTFASSTGLDFLPDIAIPEVVEAPE